MARIAFVHSNNDDLGGSDISMWRMVHACIEDGHEAVVILSRLNGIEKRYADLNVPVLRLPMPRLKRSVNPLFYARWSVRLCLAVARLIRLFRRRRIDLVYGNDLNDLAPMWAGRLAHLPTLLRIRFAFQGPTPIRRAYLSLLARPSDRIACNSDFIRETNFSDLGLASDKTLTLYNWHEDTLTEAGPDGEDDPFPTMGIPQGSRVILMPGRLEPLKGQHVLVEAAPRIFREASDAAVLFVGSPVPGRANYLQQLRNRAVELGVADRVLFHPHVDAVAPLYRAADVIVHASTQTESFGLTVLEALWHATPLVTIDRWGPAEIVGTPPAALLHQPGNADQLAEQIIRLLADEPMRKTLIDRGRERAAMFSRENQWPHYRRLIEELLASRPVMR